MSNIIVPSCCICFSIHLSSKALAFEAGWTLKRVQGDGVLGVGPEISLSPGAREKTWLGRPELVEGLLSKS
jgi:hypothetical protein